MPVKPQEEVVTEALRPFGTSIFTEMSALANECQAVNLSQGFPDFDGPEEIRRVAADAIMRGPNQYIPSAGLPSLREAVARKMRRFYSLDIDPVEEVTVTSGATEGLCATFLGLLEPEDEVILLEPSYDVYPPLASWPAQASGTFPFGGPRFELPVDELAAAFGPRTKAIVINSPMNPCCKVFSPEELSVIGDLCQKHDAFAIGDEVYEHLVYDGRSHTPLLAIPALRDRAFVISSTAKTFLHDRLEGGLRHCASPSQPCGSNEPPVHHLLRPALPSGGHGPRHGSSRRLLRGTAGGLHAEARHPLIRTKRPRLERLPHRGDPTTSSRTSRPWDSTTTWSFCRTLARDAGVAAIPCSFFWKERSQGRNLVRFCFCKRDATLEEAVSRLESWLRRRS